MATKKINTDLMRLRDYVAFYYLFVWLSAGGRRM